MIAGVGLDIAQVPRLAAALRRRPARLPQRLLTAAEHREFVRRGQCPRYLASRFAAKEALAKALGTGLRAPMLLRAAGVENDSSGRPQFKMSPALARHLAAAGVGACHLSITHDGDCAAAMVVAERAPADGR